MLNIPDWYFVVCVSSSAHVNLLCSPDKYAIRFIPRENGIHDIDVKFNGTHIPGSPFQVRVGEPGQSGDAGLVTAYGPGLERGTTGDRSLAGTGLNYSVPCTPSVCFPHCEYWLLQVSFDLCVERKSGRYALSLTLNALIVSAEWFWITSRTNLSSL